MKNIQCDKRWSDYLIVKGKNGTSIGEIGCLLTCISNILNERGIEHTPLSLCKQLQDNGGFDSQGYIQWGVLYNLYKIKQAKYLYPDMPLFSDNPKKYWIAQVVYQNTGHFCEITRTSGINLYYFDTYYGIEKIASNNIISIREIEFV